jgi:hypothetical protein
MIHPSDEEALQTIDAAVFTGDPEIIRERLTYFMERWQKVLDASEEDPEEIIHDLRRASRWPT